MARACKSPFFYSKRKENSTNFLTNLRLSLIGFYNPIKFIRCELLHDHFYTYSIQKIDLNFVMDIVFNCIAVIETELPSNA